LPDHPHRGIQALTYVLKGQTINEDSNGYYGLLNPGDVQWYNNNNRKI
jgi:quercetin 2,3-dioxygenase